MILGGKIDICISGPHVPPFKYSRRESTDFADTEEDVELSLICLH